MVTWRISFDLKYGTTNWSGSMTDQKPRDQGPDFVGVGVQKSGTSWLIQALQQHPAIYVKKKEISFFVQNFHRGYEWYHSFFAEKDGRLAGELTVSYFIAPCPNPSRKEFYPRWNPRRRLLFWRRQPSARDELHGRYPGIRIFAIFRNPVERAWSHYWFWRKRKERIGKAHRVVQFENMFANDGRWIYSYGCYARTLRYWREVFPDMGVFFFDDLKERPREMLREVFAFLGVDSYFEPDLSMKPNKTGSPAMPEVTRKLLVDAYREEVDTFQEMTGRDLGHWLETD